MKILIVEDDMLSLKLLKRNLETWNYSVVSAEHGLEGWDAYRQDPDIRIVILDWMMPEMDGIELCHRIREHESSSRRRRSYIMMLTAKSETYDLVTGLSAGADDYIKKPFLREELKARIEVGERIIELEERLERQIRDLEEALSHVRKLQGLLPICAYCKRIRDESDYWHQVESYISSMAPVEFTHSICPDCLKKHFPDIASSRSKKTVKPVSNAEESPEKVSGDD